MRLRGPDAQGVPDASASDLVRDDPFVEDEPRANGRQRAAGSGRLVDRRRRHDHEVRPVSRREPAAIDLAGRERRVEAGGAQRQVEREGFVGPEDVAGRPARVRPGDRQGEAGPGIDVLVRGVGPDREERAGVRDRPPGVADPLRAIAQPGPRPAGVAAEVDRLDRGHDPEVGEPVDIGRVDELEMLDPRPHRRPARHRPQGIEGRAHRRVADRVDGRRDAGRCRPARQRRHLLRGRGRHASRPARRFGSTCLDRPGRQEVRGPRVERAVPEDLQPAESSPV